MTRPRFLHELVAIALLWVASFLMFEFLPAYVGYPLSYGAHPFLSALYYAAWLGAVLAFYPHSLERLKPSFKGAWWVPLTVVVVCTIAFYVYAIPLLTTTAEISSIVAAHPDAPFFSYGPLYFLPKTVEILFQQVLIIETIILIFSFFGTILRTSITFGITFGLLHTLSVLHVPSDVSMATIVVAVLSGAVLPYLVLKVPNGVVYSFGLHWLFYILLALHFVATSGM